MGYEDPYYCANEIQDGPNENRNCRGITPFEHEIGDRNNPDFDAGHNYFVDLDVSGGVYCCAQRLLCDIEKQVNDDGLDERYREWRILLQP